ncbi:unnamed protein product [Rotaria magnacalcarata]|uniref:F-box domain-containing protein n=2 Tax=Rotaria magnacalcarata TaxID=392030 RepID=A0A816MNJ0_9BILA|nr:unnamed protein product [Rotaria magnacalcarata]
MVHASLDSLPVELLHRIFDFCDIQTVLISIGYVCRQLYAISNSYNRLKFKYDSSSEHYFKRIYRRVRPENVISLIINNDDTKNDRIRQFVTFFGTCRFALMASLTLNCSDHTQLEHFLKHVECGSLNLLVIKSDTPNIKTNWTIALRAITQFQVRKLEFYHDLDYQIGAAQWLFQYKLEHLTILKCLFQEYVAIIQHFPNLRTLVMRDCIVHNNEGTMGALSHLTYASALKSLIIEQCSLSMIVLESLLSLTPTLLTLKFGFEEQMFDSICDGYSWKRLIETKLTSLEQFEFIAFRSFSDANNTHFTSLKSIITSFQTGFWLKEKHWTFTCDYIFRSNQIRLYTTPTKLTNSNQAIRYEIMSTDGIHRFTQRPINKTSDDCTEETITALNLCDHRIGNREVHYLADALQHNTVLTKLDLSLNHITDTDAQYLAAALQNNATLESLSLRSNQIRNQGARYLAASLRSNKTLKSLDLYKNQIGDEGAQALADALITNTTCNSLNLDHNLTTYCVTVGAAVKIRNNQTLALYKHPIGERDIQCLTNALQNSMILTTLDLYKNGLGDNGVKYLADALEHNTTLIQLHVRWNQIGDVGAHYLAHAIGNNKQLISLDLWHNEIRDKGVHHLADALRYNMTLTTLNLRSNKITTTGAQHFLNTLQNNQTLTTIYFDRNKALQSEPNKSMEDYRIQWIN